MTNPDDGVLTPGGGQAVEITAVVTSTSDSDDVVGAYNWRATGYLSNSESGAGTAVASTAMTFSSSQVTKDLTAGDTVNLVNLAATLDLTDVTCDDFTYYCLTLAPHASANWRQADSPTTSQLECIAVTCGAGLAKISLLVMVFGFLVSHMLSNS